VPSSNHDQPLNVPVQPEVATPSGPRAAEPARVELSADVLNLPNALTVFRIFLVPFLVVVLLTKFEGREYVGLAIFWIASITDYFDGFFARRQKKVTKLGMLLDPIADKLLMSAAFISLVELGLAPAWMIVVIIGREFAVSGLRSIAAQQGVTIAASPLGKWKMISQVVAISILILGHELGEFIKLGEVALWIVVLTAIGSMVDYFAKFWRLVIRAGH
jgi:CDP-diacylglycerol--glycerol-3-phosphate 3-phosphatidyltransferase